jgi:DNA replication and repair protein RecF
VTLLSIELERFRNFPSLSLELDPRGAVLEAPNGRGKTNFLEAIHYLNLFRSFRGVPDSELASFGGSGFLVRGEVQGRDGRRRRVGVALDAGRKRLSVDGRPGRPADHVGTALSVILGPADIRLVQGSPTRRRRWLDVLLALSSKTYLRAFQASSRALRQRNRVLLSAPAGDPALLAPWTEQLVTHGAVLIDRRRGFLDEWRPRFAEISARLAGDPAAALDWRYESAVEPLDETEAAAGDALRRELERRADLERRRGATLAGPHRDDVAIVAGAAGVKGNGAGAARSAVSLEDGTDPFGSRNARAAGTAAVGDAGEDPGDPGRAGPRGNGSGRAGTERDLRVFGSQGEQRTAALALRFLETEVLTREREEPPVVLLDDVFSELDPHRCRELLGFLAPGRQVFLTTPRPLALELPFELPRYTVESGRVRRC